jgi:hypothetical protein
MLPGSSQATGSTAQTAPSIPIDLQISSANGGPK